MNFNERFLINLRNTIVDMPKELMRHNYNYPDYENVGKALIKLDNLVTRLETYFHDIAFVQTHLGGEFSYVDSEYDNPLDKRTIDLPLFMYLDLILIALNHNMENEIDLKPQINELKERVQSLRDEASKLSYDSSKFDSNKPLSEETIIDIAESRGLYSFHEKNIDGKTYIAVKTKSIREYAGDKVEYHDYTFDESKSDDFLYQEDRDYFKNIENNKKQEKIDNIRNHIKKYFINGEIPKTPSKNEFDLKLIDKNIQREHVFNPLFGIVYALANDELEDLDFTYSSLLSEERAARRHAVDGQIPVWAQEEVIPKKEEVVTKVENTSQPKKTSMFERFFGIKSSKNSVDKPESEKVAEFEKTRTLQHAEDSKKRRYAIFEIMTDELGNDVLVPLNSDDYEVVSKK